MYDLLIFGGSAGGLSAAVELKQLGLKKVRLLEPSTTVVFPDLVGVNQLDVSFGETIQKVQTVSDILEVTTNQTVYQTRCLLVAQTHIDQTWQPSLATPTSSRIHRNDFSGDPDVDVLVVGDKDRAVEITARLAAKGSRVVLAAGGMDPSKLASVSADTLRKLEKERRATLLYRAKPASVDLLDGFPMVSFGDRRTPDLQFDHVVFVAPWLPYSSEDIGMDKETKASGRVWFLGDAGTATAPSSRIVHDLVPACFPELNLEKLPSRAEKRLRHKGVIDELRNEHYNATITHFEPTHSDLWVLRVKPDNGDVSYSPGQYASLGLGYWEDRVDDAPDPEADKRWDKLIRRSYSISSRIFTEAGYLVDESRLDELEFYIVLVQPSENNTPGLTPRLALKKPGDRIYLGQKIAGRYTLDSVIEPSSEVVFLSTGTGEAPHNGMIVELLRKGHTGPIISAVSVRQSSDLGYADEHRKLAERYSNYFYLPMPTREADIPKRYLQDILRDGDLADLGITLSPESSHIFLCGNPAMIGLPEEIDGSVVFPEVEGVVEILVKQGFSLDHRNKPGNIHYEEYW